VGRGTVSAMTPLKSPKRIAGVARWLSTSDIIRLKPCAADAFTTGPKLERLIEALGSNGAADVLGIDRSQLSRCARGKEGISQELARRISDVEYVLDRALQTMNADAIGPWLTAPEPLLRDRVPLNVLAKEGPTPVVNALEAIYAGVLV
jgi:hypothetical protein